MLSNRYLLRAASVLFLSAVLLGCNSVKSSYTYGGTNYTSAESALAQQQLEMAQMLEKIQPANSPIHGKALVALPDKDEVRRNYVSVTGRSRHLINTEQVEYVANSIEAEHAAIAEAIKNASCSTRFTFFASPTQPTPHS